MRWGVFGVRGLTFGLRIVLALGVAAVGLELYRIVRGTGDYFLPVGLAQAAAPYVQGPGPQIIGPLFINLDSRANVAAHHPDGLDRVVLALPQLFEATIIMVVAYLLIRMLDTLREGDPFLPVNARRILVIGLLIVAAGLGRGPLAALAAWSVVQGTAAEHLVRIQYGISPELVGCGLLLLTLSEVFRRGARMRADVEGLV